MDELDGVSDSVVAIASESPAIATVSGGEETLKEPVCSGEQVCGSDGDGGELMVEVVGSDVYVEGVGGRGCGVDSTAEVSDTHSGKDSSSRELGVSDVGTGAMGDLVMRERGDLFGEARGQDGDPRTGNEVANSTEMLDSFANEDGNVVTVDLGLTTRSDSEVSLADATEEILAKHTKEEVEGSEQMRGLSAESHDVTQELEVLTTSASEQAQADVAGKAKDKLSDVEMQGGSIEGSIQLVEWSAQRDGVVNEEPEVTTRPATERSQVDVEDQIEAKSSEVGMLGKVVEGSTQVQDSYAIPDDFTQELEMSTTSTGEHAQLDVTEKTEVSFSNAGSHEDPIVGSLSAKEDDASKELEVIKKRSASEEPQAGLTPNMDMKFSDEGKNGDLGGGVLQEGVENVESVKNDSVPPKADPVGDGTEVVISCPAKAKPSNLETSIDKEDLLLISDEKKDLICRDEGLGVGDAIDVFKKQGSNIEDAELPQQSAIANIGNQADVIDKKFISNLNDAVTKAYPYDQSLPSPVDSQSLKVEISTDNIGNGDPFNPHVLPVPEPNSASPAGKVDVLDDKVTSIATVDLRSVSDSFIGSVSVPLSSIFEVQANTACHDYRRGEVPNSESREVDALGNKSDDIVSTSSSVALRSEIGIVECETRSDDQRNADDITGIDAEVSMLQCRAESTIDEDGSTACSPGSQSMSTLYSGKDAASHFCQESLRGKDSVAEGVDFAGKNPTESSYLTTETPFVAAVNSIDHSPKDQSISSVKIDEISENDTALERLVASGEQSRLTEEGDAVEMDISIGKDIRAATVLKCKKDEVASIPIVGNTMEEEAAVQVVDVATEKQTDIANEIDSSAIISQAIMEGPACDAFNGNLFLSGKDGGMKVEVSCFNGEGDDVVERTHILSAVISDTSQPESSNSLGGHASFPNEMLEAVGQAKAHIHDVDQNKTERGLVDGISSGMCEEVLEVAEFRRANICGSSHGDHDLSLDGAQEFDQITTTEVVNVGFAAKVGSSDADVPSINDADLQIETISSAVKELEGDNQYADHLPLDSNGEQDVGIEVNSESEPLGTSDIILKSGSSARILQSSYLLPPENEGEFCVSDLVWGKVRSHPWWPGQIFDSAAASEIAMKYQKKDCFLVAYFGDRTFAWNEHSLLKPFRSHFYQAEKQSNSEVFQNAVNCALEEVSRRVELGLACSCWSKDEYEKIESQIVENAGISSESSRRCGVDNSTGVNSFQPEKLVEYMSAVARFPTGGSERLDLVIAKAQLIAYCHFKGYRQPTEFQFCEGLVESDATSELTDIPEPYTLIIKDGEEFISCEGSSAGENDSSLKCRNSLNDSLYPRKKERSLTELMGDIAYSLDDEYDSDKKSMSKVVSPSSGKKRKAVDSLMDGADKRTSSCMVKTPNSVLSPKPFFKVGECIRRVASQMTGSPSLQSCTTDQPVDSIALVPEKYQGGNIVTETSLDEMLSQLHLAACDPRKGYNFFGAITSFFSGFRDSVVLCQSRQNISTGRLGAGRKRKASQAVAGSPEEFEFEDVNDSYWTDRMIHNYPDEQLLLTGENGEDHQLVAFDQDRSSKSGRRSRKRYSSTQQIIVEKELTEHIEERRQDLPVELVLNFAECNDLPSEMSLNKIFRRFGPLNDYETEVDRETGRARVVFKRGLDAEVACSSASKFNIFGQMHVDYQLNYSPSVAYRPLPLEILQEQEDAS